MKSTDLTDIALVRIRHSGSVEIAIVQERASEKPDIDMINELRRHLLKTPEDASWISMGTRVLSNNTNQKFMKVTEGNWVNLISGDIISPGLLPFPVTVFKWRTPL